ncbi:unnamed protein product [Paramecium octaurelia]|uniref:Sodium/calcium exchanger membrane region domain-containing protein n=1 Tax=Paramecium octaurelia TaxID=43137 RepID=A0A8S1VIW7_PAROT|nr:unnamed protein product [Paramecium octaurelia]
MTYRELVPTVEDHNAGHVIGFIIGLLYMFAFVYYIYKKYLSNLFEDFMSLLDDKEYEETYRPILYSLLNSMQYLILCFYSTFSSKSDLGVSVIIGSDAFSILFIFGLILIKFPTSHHGVLDTWTTLRDCVIYIVGLLVMLLCLYYEWAKIGTALVLLVYYILDLIVLAGNYEIKEKIMEWLTLNNEDNEFNSDQHLEYKKRRYSVTQLRDAGMVDLKDQSLQKKINTFEAILVIKYGQQNPQKKKIRQRFGSIVYAIIFSIRNQIKSEIQKRSEFYQNLYKPKQRQRQLLNDEQPQSAIKQRNDQQDNDQDENPLIDSNPMESVHQPNNQDQQPPQNQNPEDQMNQEQSKLEMPKEPLDKVLFIIFFPIHLILYLLPSYNENVVPKKLVLCFFLNLGLLCGCYYLIDWWGFELALATGIPLQLVGMIFLGFFTQLQFANYNLEVAKIETKLEFTQAFFQTAICKISLCTGLPWVLRIIIDLDIEYEMDYNDFQQAFCISIAVLCVIVFILLLLALAKGFTLKSQDGVKMIVLYGLFILISAIIIGMNILK